MLNLKAYSDELFRVDDVLTARYDEWLKFNEKYFYKQNDFNRAFLAYHFDLEQNLNQDEIIPLLNEPLKNHFLEGTFYSLNQALKALFDDSEVIHSSKYGGQPYHFKLLFKTSQTQLNKDTLKRADAIALNFKNVRSVYDGAVIQISSQVNTHIGAYITQGESIEIYPFVLRELSTKGGFNAYSTIKQDEVISINLDLRGGLAL
ncbi:hypothetical protein LMG7974_01657 [Campylobacter majalis]|uniref:Uncharacterized protein n=1 Tax=Campylobacter majalis TaxID=2790656 RepID=A0ABM8Q9D0_9BACT|nr:phage tail protein [Campylobacter majalis]CAD7289580.1 hypothetical protein LMG7974_01657 [Campylobacter majalis]